MADEKTSRVKSTVVGTGRQQTDVVLASETPTEVRPNDPTGHATDVRLADPSDVRLADGSSDVKLADSMSASAVALAEGATGAAPSFPAPGPSPAAAKTVAHRPAVNAAPAASAEKMPMALLPGAKVDDFEVVRLLGRGAFGHVYLARQLSLDRLVALKISANRGSEGRTMARLEHQHIVQVFSEKVDPDFNQRLLCMQLVPGVGLEKIIGALHSKRAGSKGQGAGSQAASAVADWTGAELLEIIDRSGSVPTTLDPSALHDREALGKMDSVEATAWFGTRLGEALDFAHRNGVLHRDIKPANILVNPYGRPMLADFNISSQPVGSESSGEEMFGGTFAYMSPEHLDAFNPEDATDHEAVNEQSDIYSLGLVLQQLLEGRIGIPQIARKPKMAETLRAMADERRRPIPICCKGHPGARMTLERSICRCLEPNPDDRFASGAQLGAQLDGCRHLREAELRLPKIPRWVRPILRHPFWWLVLLTILPQVAGSILNITYNQTQIVGELRLDQQQEFMRLVFAYNAIVYPIAIVLFVLVVRRVWQCWNALSSAERLEDCDVQAARRQALRMPRLIAGLTAFGWFPGGFIFPLAIMMNTPRLEFVVAAHFVVSFFLSGLVALAYSLCGVEFVVLRALYPALWRDTYNFTEKARLELLPVHRQLNRIELLAVSIPLVAAIVFLSFGNVTNVTFRAIVASLIVLGILGFHVTSAVTNHLSSVIVAITNTKE